MPIKNDRRPVFERLRREYNITFIDTLALDDWPPNHRIVVESIEKLKQFKYRTYATTQEFQNGLDTTPWKGEAKIQARKLTEKVKDCLSRNEATWRLACEPLVFSRLSAEVACKTCRQRVWRSEVEAKLNDNNGAASNLRQRQENRDRCRCPRSSRPEDESERVGLNKLFIDRADDVVIHEKQLADKLPQDQKPDRIYGLRQTRNFEDLLFTDVGGGKHLEDKLQELHPQPHDATRGETMLFPFLVVEAKAGNAPDDWTSIRLQTAFPIYTYLNAQQSLKTATAQKSRWAAGPMVWFFMSRGEDWRLSIAYQEPCPVSTRSTSSHCSTKIVQVWAGSITNRDDALQLFLIVDYISDWARDIYRPALLVELRILASANADIRTVFTDTDIYSSRNVLPAINQSEEPVEEHASNNDIQAAFRNLDSQVGCVRHINIRSLSEEKHPGVFIRQILKTFHAPIPWPNLLTMEQLNAIEQLWTGQSRSTGPYNLRETRFYTVHLVTYYMSASWGQTRDLCTISVAEDALDTLIQESKLKAGRGNARNPDALEGTDSTTSLLNGLALVRAASAQRNLLATVSRVTRFVDSAVEPDQDHCWFVKRDPLIWELVNNIYKNHKTGDLEPELPYLHISKSHETQVVNMEDEDPVDHPSDIIVPPLTGDLKVSGAGAILIHGAVNISREDRSPSALCVYIVRGPTQPPNQDELARIIKTTFEDRDVYHTTRDNGTLNLRADSGYRRIWNIKSPYGVFFSYGGESFVKWLRHWNKPLPERQGSPRGATKVLLMLTRVYTPWHDPRLIYGGPKAEMKRKFLKELFRVEVAAWVYNAREKIRQGTMCCVLCLEDNYYYNDDDYDEDDYDDDQNDQRIPGLCRGCQRLLDLNYQYEYGWLLWIKSRLRKALKQAISAIETQDFISQDAYCIETPRPTSPLTAFSRYQSGRVESSDSESELASIRSDESPERIASSPPNSESFGPQDTSTDDDMIGGVLNQQAFRLPAAETGGERTTRKRKRTEAEEDDEPTTKQAWWWSWV